MFLFTPKLADVLTIFSRVRPVLQPTLGVNKEHDVVAQISLSLQTLDRTREKRVSTSVSLGVSNKHDVGSKMDGTIFAPQIGSNAREECERIC